MPKDDEYDVTYTKVTLGWGELIGRGYGAAGSEASGAQGAGGPPTVKEALLVLLPFWVSKGAEASALVPLCLVACSNDDPELRVVGLDALGALAAKGQALPEQKGIEDVVQKAMEDSDPSVKAAAEKAWRQIR